jgi:hypothetical protein
VDSEPKQELEVASLVIHVEHHVKDLLQNHDHAELQSLTANGEDMEDGVHVQLDVDSEPKQELEVVSLVILVEHHVKDLLQNHDHAELQSSTANGEDMEHGVHVQ